MATPLGPIRLKPVRLRPIGFSLTEAKENLIEILSDLGQSKKCASEQCMSGGLRKRVSKRKVVGPYGAEEWGLKVGSEGWGPTRWEAQLFAFFSSLPTLVCVFLSSFWGLFVEFVLRFGCFFI